jgi:branched-chain amino acid transport system permease protein
MLAVQHQPGENLGKLWFGGGLAKRAEKETQAKALDWLGFVGMAEFANVPAGALSYGQSKLVSLARVLATEAEVLLLDEPASGIDIDGVERMLGLIGKLRERGKCVCIVEHNLHVVERLADRVYFMEAGKITAEGTMSELMKQERLSEVYFGTA